jgi:NADH-quinone oxidoreductase subunit M
VYPKPVLDVINPAVNQTLSAINQPDRAPKLVAK